MKSLKFLFVVLTLLTSSLATAEDITVVARIHSLKEAKDSKKYAIVIEDKKVAEVLNKLDPKEEALIKGRVEYHPVTVEGKTQMNPTFHVEKIIPISLKKIGKVEFVPMDRPLTFETTKQYSPSAMKVSGKVANAITLTATILMMKDLAANQSTQNKTDTLNTGVLFSAGALATGLFLWEQLKESEK